MSTGLTGNVASTSRTSQYKARVLAQSLRHTLDRVNVLEGHTGCVNALSWAKDGELLISGGDDTTARIWRMDTSDTTTPYPFVCQSVIRTGHRQNIFNVHMLPHSSRIASVSGDKQVRVFDIQHLGASRVSNEREYSSSISPLRVLQCHTGRVKRVVTEDSPDSFLTVSEDGTVRQHDLRMPHSCMENCPAPLVKLPVELSTLALSPLTPYQFIVAGESPFGYLFDRRQVGRSLEAEWAMQPDLENVTTCVRRFGRKSRAPGERRGYEHVTGARMSSSNGHEVLLSYSSDGVYLFSTRDEPQSTDSAKRVSAVSRSPKRRRLHTELPGDRIDSIVHDAVDVLDVEMEDVNDDRPCPGKSDTSRPFEEEASGDEDDEAEPNESAVDDIHGEVPIVPPRVRFTGACNMETVKDVNFLGPKDEYVASGSDDGNFFLWRKDTGDLHDVVEGDGSVVNVIEAHPSLPLIAVSGIDYTIKLFAPVYGTQSAFSRLEDAQSITERNTEAARRSMTPRIDIARLIMHYGLSLRAAGAPVGDGDEVSQCRQQ